MKHYDPADAMLGGFTSQDGTVQFYTRVNAILQPDFRLLDLGAGRGSWHYLEKSAFKRKLRQFRGKVSEYIGADVDPAVLGNPTTDRNVLIANGNLPVGDGEVDVIVCDWVLEHIVDVESFKAEVHRVLRQGGFFCARTPHSLNYVSLFARIVKNSSHVKWLRWIQPKRKAEDAFPTAYRCNTLGAVARHFAGWENFTYLYTAEPSYYFGRKSMFLLMSLIHKLLPHATTGCLFIFLRKT
jgi:SAM-dependent methyltransferase